VRYYRDSSNRDSVFYAMTGETALETIGEKIYILIEEGQYTDAQDLIDGLTATDDETENLAALEQIHLDVRSAGLNMMQVDSTQKSDLETIAASGTRSGVHAQALLRFINDNTMYERILSTDVPTDDAPPATRAGGAPKMPTGLQKNTAKQPVTADVFKMYPNPTSGSVTIAYEMTDSHSATFTMYDAFGKQIMERRLAASGQGTQNIDVSALAPGIYMCNFVSDNGTLTKDKLIITK
jgi:hypothetical protein